MAVLGAMLLPFGLAIGGFVHGVKTGSRGGYILGTIATIAIVLTIATSLTEVIEDTKKRTSLDNPDDFLIEIQDKENVSGREFKFPCKITNTTDWKLTHHQIEMVITNWEGDLLLKTTIPSGACEANSSDEFNLVVTVKSNTANELYNTDFAYLNISVTFKSLQNEVTSKNLDHTRVLQTADLEKLEQAYTEAVAVYNAGKYQQAMELFSHLGSYQESESYFQNAYDALNAA